MSGTENSPSLSKLALRGFSWTAIDKWLNKAMAMVVFIALARMLDPIDFGAIAIAMAVLGFVDVLVSQGLGFSVIMRKEHTESQLCSMFWLQAVLSVIGGIGLAVGGALLLWGYDLQRLGYAVMGMVLVLMMNNLARVHSALMTKDLRFRAIAIRNIAATFSGAAVALVMAIYNYGVFSLIAQQVVFSLVNTALSLVQCRWVPRQGFSGKALRELHSFGWKICLDRTIKQIYSQIDVVVVGVALGMTNAGIFSNGKRLISVFSGAITPVISTVLYPLFSRTQDDPDKTMRGFSKSSFLLSLVLVPAFAGISLMSQEVTVVVLGAKWIEAAPVVMLLAIAGLITWINPLMGAILLSHQRGGIILGIRIVTCIFSVTVILIGAGWGSVGVAAAVMLTDIAVTIMLVGATVVTFKPMRMGKIMSTVSGPAIFTLAAVPIAYWAQGLVQGDVIRLTVFFGSGLVLYALLWGLAYIFLQNRAVRICIPWQRQPITNGEQATRHA